MFSMDEFNESNEEMLERIKDASNSVDMGDLPSVLMVITNALKRINYDIFLKSTNDIMMQVFNMTNLEANDNNEDALNVVMCLLTHNFAMLNFIENKDMYFKYFDETVVYPLLGGGKDNE
jgi:hypothetical protein